MEEKAYAEAQEEEEEDEVQVQVDHSHHLCIGQRHLQHCGISDILIISWHDTL